MLPTLLIAEDDKSFAESLALDLTDAGYAVVVANALAEVHATGPFTHALIDLRLGADSGLDAVRHVHASNPACRIVVMTGYGSIATAVEAVRLGASDYVTKPLSGTEVKRALRASGVRPKEATLETLAAHERNYIDYVLLECGGNISHAAKRLGVHRQSLQRKLRKLT